MCRRGLPLLHQHGAGRGNQKPPRHGARGALPDQKGVPASVHDARRPEHRAALGPGAARVGKLPRSRGQGVLYGHQVPPQHQELHDPGASVEMRSSQTRVSAPLEACHRGACCSAKTAGDALKIEMRPTEKLHCGTRNLLIQTPARWRLHGMVGTPGSLPARGLALLRHAARSWDACPISDAQPVGAFRRGLPLSVAV